MVNGKKISHWLLHIIRWIVFLAWVFLAFIFLITSPDIGILLAISALFMCPLIHNKLNRRKIRGWLQVSISFVFMFVALSMIVSQAEDYNTVEEKNVAAHSGLNEEKTTIDPKTTPTITPAIISTAVPTSIPAASPTDIPATSAIDRTDSVSSVSETSGNKFNNHVLENIKNFFSKKKESSTISSTAIPSVTPTDKPTISTSGWNGTYICLEYDNAELTVNQIDKSNLNFSISIENDDDFGSLENENAKINNNGTTAEYETDGGEIWFELDGNSIIITGYGSFSHNYNVPYPLQCSGIYSKELGSKAVWSGTYINDSEGVGDVFGDEYGELNIEQIDNTKLSFSISLESLMDSGLIKNEIAYISSEDGNHAVFKGKDGYTLNMFWYESAIKITEECPNFNPYCNLQITTFE